jgi:hypothetical protein
MAKPPRLNRLLSNLQSELGRNHDQPVTGSRRATSTPSRTPTPAHETPTIKRSEPVVIVDSSYTSAAPVQASSATTQSQAVPISTEVPAAHSESRLSSPSPVQPKTMPAPKKKSLASAQVVSTPTPEDDPMDIDGPTNPADLQEEEFHEYGLLDDPWTDDQMSSLFQGLMKWKPAGRRNPSFVE